MPSTPTQGVSLQSSTGYRKVAGHRVKLEETSKTLGTKPLTREGRGGRDLPCCTGITEAWLRSGIIFFFETSALVLETEGGCNVDKVQTPSMRE